MKDLYIVINETKDGRFYGECPLLKGYSIQGTSLPEVKKDMLNAVRMYLENNINLVDSIKGVNNENINKEYLGSGNPRW